MDSRPCTAALSKWLARGSAVLIWLLVLVLAIGQGVPHPATQPPRVQIELASIALMLIGLAVGWRWALFGGLTALAGFLAFNAVEFSAHRHLAGGAFPLFMIPAALYLV